MPLTRKFKLCLVGFLLVLVFGLLAVWLSLSRVKGYVAGIHQRNMTQEIRGWGQSYAAVTNDASAIATAELVEYMSHYYVPGPGYRGPVEVEAALERQRAETCKQLTDALQRYTHLDYGTNAKRWAEWAELQKARNSEPGGAANRGQPVGSETNRTSAAAGPGG
jgi:hypothetical protein